MNLGGNYCEPVESGSTDSGTVSAKKLSALVLSASLAGFTIMDVGSGGVLSSSSIDVISSAPFQYPTVKYTDRDLDSHIYSVSEKIAQLKEFLSLSMSDISRLLEVKRPTVYQWLGGTTPRQNNLKRLNALSDIAQTVERKTGRISRSNLNTVVDGSNTLLDLLDRNSLNKREFIGFVEKLASKDENVAFGKKSIASFLQENGFPKLSDVDQQRNLNTEGSIIGENIPG
jgi:transcriptional regulator with XRE-family HTH domain